MDNNLLFALKQKALSLPLVPGVYIMRDCQGDIIYIGKAKALKNRVSQYFQDASRHTEKVRKMVLHIQDFEYVVCASEFEALVLECALIKQHRPHYNILLKDDKGYPFIRIDFNRPFPCFEIVSKKVRDGARYLGPYTGRGSARQALDTVLETLLLPTCKRVFPRDIGKGRPCLNAHMKKCAAPCAGKVSEREYREIINEAVLLIEGKHETLLSELRGRMEEAADRLEFETAAVLRDRIEAVSRLGRRQKIFFEAAYDLDVLCCVEGEVRSCVTVLNVREGVYTGKLTEVFEAGESTAELLSGFLKQYYSNAEDFPKVVLISEEIPDMELLETWLSDLAGRKVELSVPKRGDRLRMLGMAQSNCETELERVTTRFEKLNKTIELLQNMLGLVCPPKRIEAFDISNISGTDIVGGMVVFENGQPLKKAYRRFKIRNNEGQDDYHAMGEMIHRRMSNLLENEEGFKNAPDLILIDGGQGHAALAARILSECGLAEIPVFGMVKDSRHKTRAIVSPEGSEIGISATPAVFSLIGRIQEETHRYAISYHRLLRAKRNEKSRLDKISGIGEKRRNALLKRFKSIEGIKKAGIDEIIASKLLPENVARALYEELTSDKKE